MTLDECKKKIGDKIECLKETRSTGKHIIEVNMSQGGIGSVTFYTAFPELDCKRKAIARRVARVDYKSLTRNAPGTPIDFQDVTGSAYQEQDLVNMDIDDLTGAFSASSVGSNRSLGETVGGMSMLRSAGNIYDEPTEGYGGSI